jgi:hypothetical protein
MIDHHLQQRLVRRQPRLHDALHQRLADQLLVLTAESRFAVSQLLDTQG